MVSLIISVLLFVNLSLAGATIKPEKQYFPAWPFIGFGAYYSLFLTSQYLGFGFSIIELFIIFQVFPVFSVIKLRSFEACKLVWVTVPILPLLVIASLNDQFIWDDYTHWLVSSRYLFENQHLPVGHVPNHDVPGYPYGLALLHSTVALFRGVFHENISGMLTVLFASTVCFWCYKFKCSNSSAVSFFKDQKRAANVILFSSFLVLLWISFFNTRMVISAYADPLLGLCLFNLFMYLYLERQKKTPSKSFKLDFGLIFIIICCLSLKQIGLVLAMIMLLSFWTGMGHFSKYEGLFRNRFINPFSIKEAISFVVASVFYVIWGFYRDNIGISGQLSFKEFDAFNFDIMFEIFISICEQFLSRPYFPLVFLFIFWVYLRSYVYREHRQNNFLLAAMLFSLGYVFLHYVAYLGVFDKSTAIRASSFNRYIGVAGTVCLASLIIHHYERSKVLFTISLSFPLAALAFYFSLYYFFYDRFVPNTHSEAIEVGKKLAKSYKTSDPLFIVDMNSNGVNAVIIRYYANQEISTSYVSGCCHGPMSDFDFDYFVEKAQTHIIFVYDAPEDKINLLNRLDISFDERVIFKNELQPNTQN